MGMHPVIPKEQLTETLGHEKPVIRNAIPPTPEQPLVQAQQVQASSTSKRKYVNTFHRSVAPPSMASMHDNQAGVYSDLPVLYKNVANARQKWARLSHLLRAEGPSHSLKDCGMVLQGSCSVSIVVWIGEFYNRVVRRLAHRTPRRLNNRKWVYPHIKEAREITGIHPIGHYDNARRRKVLNQVSQQPIYELCLQVPRQPGSPTRITMWWEQQDPFPTGDQPPEAEAELVQ